MNMQSFIARSLLALTVIVLAAGAIAPSTIAAQQAEVLSNSSVVNMIAGKVSKDIILAKIRGTKSGFDVTAGGLVRLHQSKVPQDVIVSMMAAAADPKLAIPSKDPVEILTNNDIVQMVMGSLPRPLIIEKIRVTKARFDVTSDGLVSLQTSKVPDEVVKAMMAAPVAPPPKGDR
jgi:hypothetical protein